jgi:hypothetical protein
MERMTRRDLMLAIGLLAVACRKASPPSDQEAAAPETAKVTLAIEGMV